MKKEKLKQPYCGAELEIIEFETCDIVTTSNPENNNHGGGAGGWGSDSNGWT